MEIEELRNHWKKEDKRIVDRVKVKENAADKLRLSLNRIKVKRLVVKYQ